MNIASEQCLAARDLLKWSRIDLARAAGVSQSTVYTFERGAAPQSGWVLAVLRSTLEAAGIEFNDMGGVRLREGKP